jgi:hypothetical protein
MPTFLSKPGVMARADPARVEIIEFLGDALAA